MTPTNLKPWTDPDAVDLLEGLGSTLAASAFDKPADRKQACDEKLAELLHDTPAVNDALNDRVSALFPWGSKGVRNTTPTADAFMAAIKGGEKNQIGDIVLGCYELVIGEAVEQANEMINKWEEAA